MPVYVYETIPTHPDDAPARFEIRQRMHDAPLARHPDTGQRLRRVISGGFGFIKVRSGGKAAPTSAGNTTNCCPGCHD